MALQLKIRTQFPALVSASDPIIITKTGLSYTFSFDASSFEASLGGVYATLANNLSDLPQKYTAKDNISIHGANIASAATVNLEVSTGDLVDVTGTVAITAITLNEGHERTVRFAGILTLTNGASLVLPGSANITTAAGDFAVFRGYAAGVVRCVSYNPVNGKSVIPAAVGDITGLGTGVATALAINTGSAGAPALVSGFLGTATATSINKVAITSPATSATLTLTDGTTLTGPAASGTVMTLGNAETVSGVKSFNDSTLILKGSSSGTTTLKSGAAAGSSVVTLPVATDTLVGKATTDTLTNKTLDSAGTGNVLKVSGTTVSAGQYPGEPSTGAATAGNVGEYIESVVAAGSAVSLTFGVSKTVTSITLTAGDWDVSGNVEFLWGTTTTATGFFSSLSATTNTLDTTVGRQTGLFFGASSAPGNSTFAGFPVGPCRFSVSTSTTIFLVAAAYFTVSTMSGYGLLRARRVR